MISSTTIQDIPTEILWHIAMTDEPTFRALTCAIPKLGREVLKTGAKPYKERFGHELLYDVYVEISAPTIFAIVAQRLYVRNGVPHRVDGPAIVAGTNSTEYTRVWAINGKIKTLSNTPCLINMDPVATLLTRTFVDDNGEIQYETSRVQTIMFIGITGIEPRRENPFSNINVLSDVAGAMWWFSSKNPVVTVDDCGGAYEGYYSGHDPMI